MTRPIKPLVYPIVNGIQRFDQSKIPYAFDSNPATTSSHDYIATTIKEDAGPDNQNIIIWQDNAETPYATQRPAIKSTNALTALTGNDYEAVVAADSPILHVRMSARNEDSGDLVEPNIGSNSGFFAYNATTTLPTDVQGLVEGDHDTAKAFGTDTTARLVSGTSTTYNNTSTGFSVEAIIRPTADDLDANVHIIASIGTGHTDEWCLFLENAFIKFRNATAGIEVATGVALTAEFITHIVVSHETDDDIIIYSNGISAATGNDTNRTTGSQIVGIGNDNLGTSGEDFHGVIDEVSIYDVALTPTQVTAHATARTSNQFPVGSGVGRGIFIESSGSSEFVVVGSKVTEVPVTGGALPFATAPTISNAYGIPDGGGKVYIDEVDNGQIILVIPQTDLESGSTAFKLGGSTADQGHVIALGNGIAQELTNYFPATTQFGRGAVFLNGRAYVIDKLGNIYGSNEGDLTVWNALNVINAEREFDGGAQIIKHHDHIAAFGARSLEFFFDAGNPTASALSRREDVFYKIGLRGNATSIGDVIYFVGTTSGNDYSLYKLDKFTITKISDERIGASLESMILGSRDNYFTLSGFSVEGRHLVSIAQVDASETAAPAYTYTIKEHFIFDVKYQAMYKWISGDPDLDPSIIDYAFGGSYVTHNGEAAHFRPVLAATAEDDPSTLADSDAIPAAPVAIDWFITSPNFMMGSGRRKFWKALDLEGTFGKRQSGSDPVNIDLSWSDDFYETFSTPRTVDFSNYRFIERAMGSSRQRAYKIQSTTKAKVFLNNWVIRAKLGTH
jgi:hypothetical protein